jgi:hypothetical protein
MSSIHYELRYMAAKISILQTKHCGSWTLSVVSMKVETTAQNKKHGCRVFFCFPASDGCRSLKSRVPDTIRFSDRRLWRLSKFYPVARSNDNEKNKKLLNAVGGHTADITTCGQGKNGKNGIECFH